MVCWRFGKFFQIKYNIPLTLRVITVPVTRNINAVHVFYTVDSHTTNFNVFDKLNRKIN